MILLLTEGFAAIHLMVVVMCVLNRFVLRLFSVSEVGRDTEYR